jgi:hypothetical protein
MTPIKIPKELLYDYKEPSEDLLMPGKRTVRQ